MAHRKFTEQIRTRKQLVSCCGPSAEDTILFALGNPRPRPGFITIYEQTTSGVVVQAVKDDGEGELLWLEEAPWASGTIDYEAGIVRGLRMPEPPSAEDSSLYISYSVTEPWTPEAMSQAIGAETWEQSLVRLEDYIERGYALYRQDMERLQRLYMRQRLRSNPHSERAKDLLLNW